MRFKGLDLNLLVALDILLSERNVSRAADKLCLSQSATSGALARLREYFQDDLLVQVGRKMVLTPRAINLEGKVRAALVQIDGTILRSPAFEPSTADRQITIVVSDYATIAGLRQPLEIIAEKAPNLRFDLRLPGSDPQSLLERGEVDFLLMPEIYLAPDHPSVQLFDDSYAIVVDAKRSPFGDTIKLEEFYAADHVTAQFQTFTPTYETWFLDNHSEQRRIVASAESFLALPFLIVNTERIGLMHRRLIEALDGALALRMIPPPFDVPPIVEFLQWNAFNDGDQALAWVRSEICGWHGKASFNQSTTQIGTI